ncbi:MAG: nucleotide exchange factor GrpE [Candidatus Nealsonbacteria bacterium RIFCSPLOWO2_01_FULL_43_32]|uniref:Protein GrpE n=1 Tax=Candidatus Nealsonbacteria bacterium RIFCSPLOWO2_01_FULL_43_32 TaxID=1801672 RepID=A0A1G2EFE9_9BACT|nr:MAG: nucleotide exchange factor GrpE [Candidatus Nealsonbacteria bacterium RIFCSPLOWO2_01_FULL_43_32]
MDTQEIQKKLENAEKQAQEYLAGWQRARADFLNYKKEEMERIGEFLKYANEEFILKLLPILDNFTEAEKSIPEEKKDNYLKGIAQIKKQFEDFLKAQGVEEIKTAGEKFDLNFMEAVEKEEEERKGYKMNGRLLRPAKVRVTK